MTIALLKAFPYRTTCSRIPGESDKPWERFGEIDDVAGSFWARFDFPGAPYMVAMIGVLSAAASLVRLIRGGPASYHRS